MRPGWSTITAGLAIATLVSCGAETDGAQVEPEAGTGDHGHAENEHDRSQEVIYAQVDDPLDDASLEQLGAASDRTFQATVVGREDDVEIGADDSLLYSIFELRPEDSAEVVRVAMSTSNGRGERVEVIGRPAAPSVGDSGIWMITRMDPSFGFPDHFVLVGSAGHIPIASNGEVQTDEYNPGVAAVQQAERLDSGDAVLSEISGS